MRIEKVQKIQIQNSSDFDNYLNNRTYTPYECDFQKQLDDKISKLRQEKYICCDSCKLRKESYHKVIFADMIFNLCDNCYIKFKDM